MALAFKLLKTLDDVYGNRFGFDACSNAWALASTGIVHMFRAEGLQASYEVPGYEAGNLVLRNGKLRIGLFEIDGLTGVKTYQEQLAALLATNTRRYRIAEVVHSPVDDILAVALRRLASRNPDREGVKDGPSDRLLLLDYSKGELLRVVEENYEALPYAHLLLGSDQLCYTLDSLECVAVPVHTPKTPGARIDNFIPYVLGEQDRVLGTYDNRFVQYREKTTLDLESQLSFEDGIVAGITTAVPYPGLLIATGDGGLQYWLNDTKAAFIQLDGAIEGMAVSPEGLCYVACTGAKDQVLIFSIG